jgi:hypothetical protein
MGNGESLRRALGFAPVACARETRSAALAHRARVKSAVGDWFSLLGECLREGRRKKVSHCGEAAPSGAVPVERECVW